MFVFIWMCLCSNTRLYVFVYGVWHCVCMYFVRVRVYVYVCVCVSLYASFCLQWRPLTNSAVTRLSVGRWDRRGMIEFPLTWHANSQTNTNIYVNKCSVHTDRLSNSFSPLPWGVLAPVWTTFQAEVDNSNKSTK